MRGEQKPARTDAGKKNTNKNRVRQTFDRFKGHLIAGGVSLLLVGGAAVTLNACSNKPKKDQIESSGKKDNGREKIVPEMLDPDQKGLDELFTASQQGHAETVKLLLNRLEEPDVDDLNHALLRVRGYAGKLSEGHAEVIKILIDKGADVNARDRHPEDPSLYLDTLLIRAAGRGEKEIVELLLEKGADVNIRGWAKGTALMAAAGEGHVEIVKLLLDKGAEINARANGGQTALILACVAIRDDVGKGKLSRDASPKDVIKILVEAEADVNVVSPYEKGTALDILKQNEKYSRGISKDDDMIKYLEKHGAN